MIYDLSTQGHQVLPDQRQGTVYSAGLTTVSVLLRVFAWTSMLSGFTKPTQKMNIFYFNFYFIFIFIYFLVLHHQAGEKGLSGSPCEGQLMEHQLMLMAICGPHRL